MAERHIWRPRFHTSLLTDELARKWISVYENPPPFLAPVKSFDSDYLFKFREVPLKLPQKKTASYLMFKNNPFIEMDLSIPGSTPASGFYITVNYFGKKTEKI